MIRMRPINAGQLEALRRRRARNRHTAMALQRRGLVYGVRWSPIVDAHVFNLTLPGVQLLQRVAEVQQA